VDEVPRPEKSLLALDEQPALPGQDEEGLLVRLGVVEAVDRPGSRTVTLIPSCVNSTGGSRTSLSKLHAAPLVSELHHSTSRTFTTNQPSVTGARPEPEFSSRASGTAQAYWFPWGCTA
jgi:hypothetical protein